MAGAGSGGPNKLDLNNSNDTLQNLPYTTFDYFKVGGASGTELNRAGDYLDINLTAGEPDGFRVKDSSSTVLFHLRDDGSPVFKEGNSPAVSTQTMDFYIATTGNDLTGDGTSGSRWATFQKVFDSIPFLPEHDINIFAAKGCYRTFNLLDTEKFTALLMKKKGLQRSLAASTSGPEVSINIVAESYFSTEKNVSSITASTSNSVTIDNVSGWTLNQWTSAKLVLYGGVDMGGSVYEVLGNTAASGGSSTITISGTWKATNPNANAVFDLLTTDIDGSQIACGGIPDNRACVGIFDCENIKFKGLIFDYSKYAGLHIENSKVFFDHCLINMDNSEPTSTGAFINNSNVEMHRVAIINGVSSAVTAQNNSMVIFDDGLVYDSANGVVSTHNSYIYSSNTSFNKNNYSYYAYYQGKIRAGDAYSLASVTENNAYGYVVEKGGQILYSGGSTLTASVALTLVSDVAAMSFAELTT